MTNPTPEQLLEGLIALARRHAQLLRIEAAAREVIRAVGEEGLEDWQTDNAIKALQEALTQTEEEP